MIEHARDFSPIIKQVPDSALLVTITLTFLLAGFVKGVVGLGLPTVALALLTALIGLHPAMALLLAPSLATNVLQATVGGRFKVVLARIWPLLLTAMLTIWIGAQALTRADVALLSALLGALLVTYAVVGLRGPQLIVPARSEVWAAPLVGAINGVLTGLTGSFVFPGVLYLQGIGLQRDALVQAMGMLFMASTLGLAFALGGQQLLTTQLGWLSAAAVLPAVVGMLLGQRVRGRIPERSFRRAFLLALLVLGVYIIASSVLSAL